MYSSPFTASGMASSSSNTHNPNVNSWNSQNPTGPLTNSFGDSLTQSRSHYQSGYLMSTSQNNNAPQGSQRVDEVPIVPTKAKMNSVLSRGSASTFGLESMFQSSNKRQTLADEDAPPLHSINDIPNETHAESGPPRFQPRTSSFGLDSNSNPRNARTPAPHSSQPQYVVVFGYPNDKYNAAVEYFKSLGNSTEPELTPELINCFRIGYYDPGDAMRAVRKNGEILGGSWMVGAKFSDSTQADLMGHSVSRNAIAGTQVDSNSNNLSEAMVLDETPSSARNLGNHTPQIGTPIKLAPSTAAFRRTGGPTKPVTSPEQRGWGSTGLPNAVSSPASTPTGGKSVIGQVSDMIFGW